MVSLYHAVVFQPILNALVYLYETVAFQDIGIAIILLTILIRLILWPLFHRSIRHQAVMQQIQPKLKRIQEDLKDKREEQARAMMELFSEHKINPFSGIGLLLLQLPILFALYHVFTGIFDPATAENLYSFVRLGEPIRTNFLGLINLAESNIVMVALAAIAQYFQGKHSLRNVVADNNPAASMQKNLVYIGPVLTLLIFWNFPAAVSLYWVVTSVIGIVQQVVINKHLKDGKLGTIRKRTD